jgi:hypothetical protein
VREPVEAVDEEPRLRLLTVRSMMNGTVVNQLYHPTPPVRLSSVLRLRGHHIISVSLMYVLVWS